MRPPPRLTPAFRLRNWLRKALYRLEDVGARLTSRTIDSSTISVDIVDLSGLTEEEARARIEPRLRAVLELRAERARILEEGRRRRRRRRGRRTGGGDDPAD